MPCAWASYGLGWTGLSLDTLRTSVAGVEGECNLVLDNLLATSSDPGNMVGAHLVPDHIWPSPTLGDLPQKPLPGRQRGQGTPLVLLYHMMSRALGMSDQALPSLPYSRLLTGIRA